MVNDVPMIQPMGECERLLSLFAQQEIAEQTGNAEEAERLRSELEELEEKATHLDKVRSKNLSAIR